MFFTDLRATWGRQVPWDWSLVIQHKGVGGAVPRSAHVARLRRATWESLAAGVLWPALFRGVCSDAHRS